MFRGLIAFVLALTFVFTGIAKPAYAYSSDSVEQVVDLQAANSPVTDSFWGGFFSGLANAAGFAIGGTVACYILDGVATTVFPPAAAAAALCPTIGAASGGASATSNGVKALAGAH